MEFEWAYGVKSRKKVDGSMWDHDDSLAIVLDLILEEFIIGLF